MSLFYTKRKILGQNGIFLVVWAKLFNPSTTSNRSQLVPRLSRFPRQAGPIGQMQYIRADMVDTTKPLGNCCGVAVPEIDCVPPEPEGSSLVEGLKVKNIKYFRVERVLHVYIYKPLYVCKKLK